ncbi:MAG: PDZ domain-containing protein [Lachnospiraceae bacterium]|nr:PDZ domain-containing protein [Lachnospiraceae bacterium]
MDDRNTLDKTGTGSDFSSDFLQEEIKNRPVNRKRLVRRLMLVAFLAAVFGAVACVIFLLLEPVISRIVSPETAVTGVTYPEEQPYEELTPEEMVENEQEQEADKEQELIREEIQRYLSEGGIDGVTYEQIAGGLREVASGCSPWLADVSGITEDTDWFNAPYENTGTSSGIVIARGDEDILVLVCAEGIDAAQRVQVKFYGELIGAGEMLGYDPATGMAVIRVPVSGLHKGGDETADNTADETGDSDAEVPEQTAVTPEQLERIQTAQLGSSTSMMLTGKSVVAVGRPTGDEGSVGYGFVSSVSQGISVADAQYRQITTDIYGSTRASGVLVNLRGEVVGIIDPAHSREDMRDVLCGIGISELKVLIEHLSAGKEKPYLGIYFTDVPYLVRKEQGIPEGVYISGVAEDSPAMNAGIQKGDLLVRLGSQDIPNSVSLSRNILEAEQGIPVQVVVKRWSGTEYAEIAFSVVPE